MEWELVTWGLLTGIVGMVWMMVLAILNDRPHERPPDLSYNGSEHGSAGHGQEQREAA